MGYSYRCYRIFYNWLPLQKLQILLQCRLPLQKLQNFIQRVTPQKLQHFRPYFTFTEVTKLSTEGCLCRSYRISYHRLFIQMLHNFLQWAIYNDVTFIQRVTFTEITELYTEGYLYRSYKTFYNGLPLQKLQILLHYNGLFILILPSRGLLLQKLQILLK